MSRRRVCIFCMFYKKKYILSTTHHYKHMLLMQTSDKYNWVSICDMFDVNIHENISCANVNIIKLIIAEKKVNNKINKELQNICIRK